MDNFDLKLKKMAEEEKETIPASLDDKIELVLHNLPKKNFRRRNTHIAAAIAMFLIITPLITVYGKNIDVVGKVIEFFKGASVLDFKGNAEKYEKYSQDVGKTVTDNGVSVTIDSVAYDGSYLMVFYTAYEEGEKKANISDDISNWLWGRVKINGKEPKLISSPILGSYVTSDGKLKGMFRENISGNKLPEKLNVSFSVETALGRGGKWEFQFDISKHEALKESNIIPVDIKKHIEYPDRKHDIKIEEVALTPFGNQIIISEKFKMGNNIPFSHFALYDDKGNVLDLVDRGYAEGKTKSSFEFLKAKKGIKSITLVPIYTYSDTAPKEINYNPTVEIDKFPLELKMSSKGSLVVEKIVYTESSTEIYYTKKGVVLYGGSFNLIDESGKDVLKDIKYSRKDYVVDTDKGLYVSILPKVDATKKYKLQYVTDEKFDLLEQYKIEIPLVKQK